MKDSVSTPSSGGSSRAVSSVLVTADDPALHGEGGNAVTDA
jgi:hypothetical protein